MSPLSVLCPLPTGMSRCSLVGSGWSEQGSNPKVCQSASFHLPWNQERVFQQRASSCLATQQRFASYLMCYPRTVPGSSASAPRVPGHRSPDSGLLVQDALTGWGTTILSAKASPSRAAPNLLQQSAQQQQLPSSTKHVTKHPWDEESVHVCTSYGPGMKKSGCCGVLGKPSTMEKHQLGLHHSGFLNFLLEGSLPLLCPTDKALLCACHVPCSRLKVTANHQCNLGLLWLLHFMKLSLHCCIKTWVSA